MREEKVTCDGCGADLTVRTNSMDYRLVLDSENKPGYGAGFYTDMYIYPSVERAHHFCGLGCLDRWRDRERMHGKLMGEKLASWKREHGTKWAGGESYPEPPKDVRAAWSAESRAAADGAFPLGKQRPT